MTRILPGPLRAALSGPRAASATLCLWMAAGLTLRTFIADSVWGAVLPGQKVAALAGMFAAGGAVMALARWTWLRRSATTGVPASRTLITYAVAGLAVAAGQAAADPRMTFAPGQLCVRALLSMAALICFVFILDQRDRQRSAVSALLAQTRRLERTRSFYLTEVTRIRADLAAIVTSETGPALTSCLNEVSAMSSKTATSASLRSAAERIRQCESGVVRELSHALDGGTDPEAAAPEPSRDEFAASAPEPDQTLDPEAPAMLPGRGRARVSRNQASRNIVGNALSLRPFWPGPLAACVALGGAGAAFPQRGMAFGLVTAAVTFAVVFSGMTIADRHLTGFMRRRNIPVRIAVAACVFIVNACVIITVLWMISPSINVVKAAAVLFFGELAMASTMGIARAIAFARRESLQELSATLESISWETARLQEDELQIRREVAAVLHGDTQSRLLAIAISLDQLADSVAAGAGSASIGKVLASAESALRTTLDQLGFIGQNCGNTLVADIQLALGSTASVWSAIVKVDIDCPDDAAAAINRSPAIATAVAQAVRESISNACRHGRATRIDIAIRVSGHAAEISAVDNGDGVRANYIPGLGLTSIVRSGARVELTRAQRGGTELMVQLPIA